VVRDTGEGLSREAQERVFEPFFTNKPRGTGLGLAVSKGIIQAHGGTIRAGNVPSGGARFEIRLPTSPVTWPIEETV
jgi:signal transduction histidine kinase